MSGTVATGTLAENSHVKELLEIFKDNKMNAAAKEFVSVLSYVSAVESQLDRASEELQTIRHELGAMREAQNHPLRTALQNAARSLEATIAEARARLDEVKRDIIEGAKKAVSAFKQHGISALHNVASFLHFKEGLNAVKANLNAGIKEDERAIAAIESASAKYHEAGRRVRNAGRALANKGALRKAKPNGKLAKALEAPFRKEKACLSNAVKSVDAAIARLDRLAENAKPSVCKAIKDSSKESAGRRVEPSPEKSREKPKSREASL